MEERNDGSMFKNETGAPAKWLVLGGSGFIGSHFVRHLLQNGHTEIVIADLKPPVSWLGGEVTYREVDIRKPLDFDLPFKPDVVVNFAAIAKDPGHEEHEYMDANVTGSENVLNFCRKHGLNKVWFTSSMSTYGPREEACAETSPQEPETPYGISKFKAEKLHYAWQEESPERLLRICRPAVIYGRGEGGNFTRLAKALNKGFFFYPGRSDTIKSNGYVLDLVRSLHFMGAQTDAKIVYNYAYANEMTIRDICETFCKVGGFKKPMGTMPAFILLTLAKMVHTLRRGGDLHPARVYKVMRSTNITPTELVKRGFVYQTNLETALTMWRDEDPKGEFV